MLGTLAKYIFGGLMSDAPESSATEMQYHTREVNDWLLVDMPDQAIDDEDMNSESDEDEILTALPLLMAEEVTLQIVQSCEELKDHSACDNSSGKVQKRLDVKIRSVPSGVQHISGDKNQGNFVDKVEDNFPTKVQDISVSKQDFPNSIIQDKYDIQVRDISIQTNSNDKIQISNYTMPKYSDNKNKCVSSQLQCNLDKEIESNSTAEVLITEENSTDKMQAKSNDDTRGKSCDATSQSSSDEGNSYEFKTKFFKSAPGPKNSISNLDEVIKTLREVERELQIKAHQDLVKRGVFKPFDVKEIFCLNGKLVTFDDDISDFEAQKALDVKIIKKSDEKKVVTEIENCVIDIQDNKFENQDNTAKAKFPLVSGLKFNVNIEETKENSGREQKFLMQEQHRFYQQCNNDNQLNKIQDNFTCGRRLYSQVVKGCNDSVQVNFNDSDDQIISSFDNKIDAVLVEVENNFLTDIQNILTEDQSNNIHVILPGTEIHKMYDQYVSKTEANENNPFQRILSNEKNKRYEEYKEENIPSNEQIQDNLGFGRKLYSQVVCENKPRVQENSNKTRKDFLGIGKYDRCVQIFDHDLESSDDEMEENSNYEMHESSDAEIEENSDVEIEENFDDETSGKLCATISQFPSDEENDYWSETEIFKSLAPRNTYSKEFISEALKELSRVERELQKKALEQLAKRQESNGIVPWYPQLYPVPKDYDIYTRALEGTFYPVNSTGNNQLNEIMALLNTSEGKEEKPSSPTPCLITNSAEIVQNLMNQMSTVLPKKTATVYIKEQIKELKPMQQAIQFENRKYMTRSQFNRQNRNYMYQSSVKTNRRKNLQRNHSGANNNRKC